VKSKVTGRENPGFDSTHRSDEDRLQRWGVFEDGICNSKGGHEMATGAAARNEDDGTMA
jgi:hypothetical protein